MTAKSVANLTTEATTNLADNTAGDISAADVRTMVVDLIDSLANLTDLGASQTATGSGKFVLQTTPTLITPVLGVATGTSIALGGATIGSNALAITGTATISSSIQVGIPSVATGALKLGNSASAFYTSIQAGNAVAARTYTWPTNFGAAGTALTDAAGDGTLSWAAAGGTPGGSDTQVQFNDSSAFGGSAGLTYDKTNKALTVGGATVTTSNPVLNLSQTWNAGGVTFTGLKFNVTNTASAAGSLLADFQLGGNTMAAFAPARSSGSGGELRLGYFAYPYFYQNTNGSLILGFDSSGDVFTFSILSGYRSFIMGGVTLGNDGTAGQLRLGATDAASPVAQTLAAQSVVAGTANTAGALTTFAGSQGTGTGVGGDIAFKTAPAGGAGSSQNALAEVIRILNTGNIKFTNAANFSANNTVATVLGSVGPTGANTTVQEWLTFKNAAGTTRYVPCF